MEETINILGDDMPLEMFNDFAETISPTLKGFKYSCAPMDFQCPICHGGNTNPVIMTECNHMYHLDCIDKWEEVRNNCPTCRNVLPGCTKTIVETLLYKLKEHIRMRTIQGWCHKLDDLSYEDLGVVKKQAQELADRFRLD
jgi:hypothetical protein